MVSPVTLPSYLMVILFPSRSRTTLKVKWPLSYLASWIGASWPIRPLTVPVSLPPSSFSFIVDSRDWPPNSIVHFQVPVGLGCSSARATPAAPAKTRSAATAVNRFIGYPETRVCAASHSLTSERSGHAESAHYYPRRRRAVSPARGIYRYMELVGQDSKS